MIYIFYDLGRIFDKNKQLELNLLSLYQHDQLG
jgi:hypothetical protein